MIRTDLRSANSLSWVAGVAAHLSAFVGLCAVRSLADSFAYFVVEASAVVFAYSIILVLEAWNDRRDIALRAALWINHLRDLKATELIHSGHPSHEVFQTASAYAFDDVAEFGEDQKIKRTLSGGLTGEIFVILYFIPMMLLIVAAWFSGKNILSIVG